MNRFNVYFIMDEDFESSIDLFKQNKEYKLVDANSYNKSIDIVAKHPRQSESEAKKQIKGLLYSVDITAFRFTPGSGPLQESKRSKVNTLIERIVERVIAKKLKENKLCI